MNKYLIIRPPNSMMRIHDTVHYFDEQGRVVKRKTQTPHGFTVVETIKHLEPFGFEVTVEKLNAWGGKCDEQPPTIHEQGIKGGMEMKNWRVLITAILLAIFTIGFPIALLNSWIVQFIVKWVFIFGAFGLLVLFFYNVINEWGKE